MTYYRTNFGPVDDGSTDTMEAHDAWSEVQDQVRDGWLVPVEVPKMVECRNPECRALIEVEIVGAGEKP